MEYEGKRTAAAHLSAVLHCRDRELSNLRALLRSQTRKLEELAEEVRDGSSRHRISRLVNEVLEALS